MRPWTLARTLEVHVGAEDVGDEAEVGMLRAAVEARQRGASRSETGSAANTMQIKVQVHKGRDHNVVVDLRDSGELHGLLKRLIDAPRQEGEQDAFGDGGTWSGEGDVSTVEGGKGDAALAGGETAGVSAAAADAALEGLDVGELRTRGQAAYRRGEYSDAIRLFGAASSAAPSDENAACDLAAAALAGGQHTAALEAAEQAIRQRPTWTLPWVRYTRALRLLGRYRDAIFCCHGKRRLIRPALPVSIHTHPSAREMIPAFGSLSQRWQVRSCPVRQSCKRRATRPLRR